MHSLLEFFRRPTAVEALELLDSKFPDAKVQLTSWETCPTDYPQLIPLKQVRAYAVECLNDLSYDELLDYFPQLVQVIKYEPYHDSGDLSIPTLYPLADLSDNNHLQPW